MTYRIYDDGTNSGYVSTPGNSHVAVGVNVEVSAADFANVVVHGGAGAGAQTLWVKAYDGHDWGAWTTIDLTTTAASGSGGSGGSATNHAPVLTSAAHTVAAASTTALSN